jgi:uncharacterized protein
MELRRKPTATLLFFALTLSLSWLIWIPLAIAEVNVREVPWFFLMTIGGASPSLIGILLIIRNKSYSKSEFVRAFLSLRWIGVKNIGLILLAIAIPFGLSLALDYLLIGNVPNAQRFMKGLSSPISIAYVVFSLIYSGPLSEEFGWRGFATKHLLPQWGLLKVGIIVGAVWSVWHYPLLFLSGQYEIENYLMFIPIHLLKHIGLATIITYFFKRTNGSVLSAMLIHFLSNTLVNVLYPIPFSANAIHTLLILIVALICVLIQRRRKCFGLEDGRS